MRTGGSIAQRSAVFPFLGKEMWKKGKNLKACIDKSLISSISSQRNMSTQQIFMLTETVVIHVHMDNKRVLIDAVYQSSLDQITLENKKINLTFMWVL